MIDVGRRWCELCALIGAAPEPTRVVWHEIAAAYQEVGRHYHTLAHISALLALAARHSDAIRDRVAFDLAVILHDVVYDPRGSDNEGASAVWACERLSQLGARDDLVQAVTQLIELSRHRSGDIAGLDPASDAARFVDFDLSILAAPPSDYADYAAAIRKEYASFPDQAYKPGRAKVLRALLERSFLFVTPQARGTWEAAARRNLEAEIRMLTGL